MKKLLFILLLIIPAFIINAQDVQPKEELASIQVIDHLYDKTSEAISELAKALEVPAEHVYNVLVRQQIVIGISILIGVVLSLIFSYTSWLILFKKHDFEKSWIYQDTEGYWTISIMLSVLSLILIITLLVEGLPRLINPEYGAIKEIMSIL